MSPKGFFQVNEVKACAGFTIQLTPLVTCGNPAGNPSDPNPACAVSFTGREEDFMPIITNTSFTYNNPGIYTLRYIYGDQEDNLQITIVENVPPPVQVASCSGNEVVVTVNDSRYSEYIIDYDNAPNPDEVTISPNGTNRYGYGNSNPRTISVRGHDMGAAYNCAATNVQVIPLATIPTPTLTQVKVLDATSARLEFNGIPNVLYRIEIAQNNNTTFQFLKTIINTTIDTVRNLRGDDSYYCFRVVTIDACTNAFKLSNVVCSSNFDLTPENNQNRLNWITNNAGVVSQTIERTITSGTPSTFNVTGNSSIDTDVNCGTQYCYQLTMNYANVNGLAVQSISMPKCGTAISTDKPTAISNISSIVGDNEVTLGWQMDPAFSPAKFTLFKNSNGTTTTLGETNDATFSDNSYLQESPSCYQIKYDDICGNTSDLSIESCPIILTGNVNNDNSIQLNWTAYTGWVNGVNNYVIERYDANGQLIATIPAGTLTTYLDATQDLDVQIFIYVVRAFPNDNTVSESVSNRIVLTKEPNLFYPTAFTPNGDGLNDIFNVYGQYIENFQMDIFNRWGELMFTTSEIQQGWDGTYRGNLMPEGTYTFVATIRDKAGRTFKKSGTVVLMKKR
ncbi:T9SS type B sorting domain-containing protein [Chryseosolibacter indicus]|uniref:Gliding motility-associated C-terminal domain-containing protein n=1 Tax=Chryseosolibacter indicus TaxID=2782351 RepID=A0ABS5VLP2_9BACT|nr:T9SS type B sorting domain-containing protein [Chryseosolibacter indicus]MBT1702362.1 gliding motility-associated C-terminal domain-containing protein [Chryseosolibacter indicus]